MAAIRGTARRLDGWVGRGAVWLALIAVLMVTLPSFGSLCGLGRVGSVHAERGCKPCCASHAAVNAAMGDCCSVRPVPSLPAGDANVPAQLVKASAGGMASDLEALPVYRVARIRLFAGRSALLRPNLRI